MFCYNCGSQQEDSAKFCGACGAKLVGVAPAPTTDAPSPAQPTKSPRTKEPPPASAPSQPTAAPLQASPAGALSVESWTVSAQPPDSDGDSRFEAKAVVIYEGDEPAHLARLRWVAFDPNAQIPTAHGETDVTQDIDDGDDIELEASSYAKLPAGTPADACRVEAQVLVFPGTREPLLKAPLPDAGVIGERPERVIGGGASLVAWSLACTESSDESASYALRLVVRNDGQKALAALTARARVHSRKDELWVTEFLQAQTLAPGEQRTLDTTLWVSARARARKGATVEVVAIPSTSPIVFTLPAVAPAVVASMEEGDPAEEGEEASSGAGSLAVDGGGGGRGDHLLTRIVAEFRRDPGNKLLIGADDLLAWCASEMGRSVSAAELCAAVESIQRGDADDSQEQIVDAATSLCHQAADRCFGGQTGPEEWEEVDISTDWCNHDGGNPQELYVVVRPS